LTRFRNQTRRSPIRARRAWHPSDEKCGLAQIGYNIRMGMKDLAASGARRYRTTQDMVADGLRQGILSGALRSGQPLRQEQIAEDFGVSKIPVREALRQLAGEGLVTFSPHRGAVVSKISYEEAHEITEIRISLESLALRLAVPNITKEDLEQVEAVFRLAGSEEDISRYANLCWKFHELLCSFAGRPRLQNMIESLHATYDLYVRVSSREVMRNKARSQRQHREILDACRSKDAAAVKALEDNIWSAFDEILAHMERFEDPGEDGAHKAG
jgi:DNA-binding GntR family transcriptional regulator